MAVPIVEGAAHRSRTGSVPRARSRAIVAAHVGALGVLVLSGCGMALGGSIEASGGLVRVQTTMEDGSTVTVREPGMATTAGLSFNIEFDENRDANLGAGFGPHVIRPSSGGRSASAVPMTVTYAGSIENRGWKVRPRGYFGFAFERGYESYHAAFFAVGASIHPAQGWAVHVSLGPQVVVGENREYGKPSLRYVGRGGQVRIRLFKMLLRACDPKTPPAELRNHAALPAEPC